MFVFHKKLRERLAKEWKEGRLPQCLCLWGERGIGKRTVALWLAQMMACRNANNDGGCGACNECQAVQQGRAPDVIILGQGETGKEIGIEQVRAARDRLAHTPLALPFHLALILDADGASVPAQQALLKTLEEPREFTRIILTASSFGSLLPTLQSRVTPYRLLPVPHANIQEALEEDGVKDERLIMYSRFARGIPGRLWHGTDMRSDLDDEIEALERVTAAIAGPFWSVRKALEVYFSLQIEADTGAALIRMIAGIEAMGASLTRSNYDRFTRAMRNAHHHGNRELVIDAAAFALI